MPSNLRYSNPSPGCDLGISSAEGAVSQSLVLEIASGCGIPWVYCRNPASDHCRSGGRFPGCAVSDSLPFLPRSTEWRKPRDPAQQFYECGSVLPFRTPDGISASGEMAPVDPCGSDIAPVRRSQRRCGICAVSLPYGAGGNRRCDPQQPWCDDRQPLQFDSHSPKKYLREDESPLFLLLFLIEKGTFYEYNGIIHITQRRSRV